MSEFHSFGLLIGLVKEVGDEDLQTKEVDGVWGSAQYLRREYGSNNNLRLQTAGLGVESGNAFYISALCKHNSNNKEACIRMSGFTGTEASTDERTKKNNEWEVLSANFTSTGGSRARFYVSGEMQKGEFIEGWINHILVLDLTKMFGKGNEPYPKILNMAIRDLYFYDKDIFKSPKLNFNLVTALIKQNITTRNLILSEGGLIDKL